MTDKKVYHCPNCKQDLVKKEKLVYECPDCQKTFELKQGQLIANDIDDEDNDEIEKIDNDIQTLEMLDFFDDEFI